MNPAVKAASLGPLARQATGLAAMYLALFCCLAVAREPGPAPALQAWAGAYVYEQLGPATAGGVVVPMSLRLTVMPTRPEPSARLEQTGNQVNRIRWCDVEATAYRLVVRFRSFGDGRAVNAYGVAEFAPGEVLFSMQRVSGAHPMRLKTRWQALRPEGAAAAGRFFAPAPPGAPR